MMYLEGGNPAAMMVRAGGADAAWSGNRLGTLFGGNGTTDMPLPNILGVKAAARPAAP
jgi:microcystin-dependent protein